MISYIISLQSTYYTKGTILYINCNKIKAKISYEVF